MTGRSIISTAIMFLCIVAAQCVHAQEKNITIGLIGDSTVAATYGWGPAFSAAVGEHVTVLNYAQNGATLLSLSTRADLYPTLNDLIQQQPDYIIIQFGHNDMKRYDTQVYSDYLTDYVERITLGGIKAIVFSSVTRRIFDEDGNISPLVINGRTLQDYALAAQAVAQATEVPFVDLNSISIEHHNEIGPEASAAYNYIPTDTTHFSPLGAAAIADLIIEALAVAVPGLDLSVDQCIEVNIDIKPGSDTNPLNLKSKGGVPVAILSSAAFDATSVDVGSVRFEETPPVHHSFKDIDGDGVVDLLLHFKTRELVIEPTQTEAMLIGQTTSGVLFVGIDKVKIRN